MYNVSNPPHAVIRYYYQDADITQRVPYMSQDELDEAVVHALDNKFPMNDMTIWVWNENAANRAFNLMDIYGQGRCRIFGLTANNLLDVLGENMVILPLRAASC